MYWIPIILYLIVLSGYILFTHSYSEFATAFAAGIIMYIVYFCVDFIYQIILCKYSKIPELIINSLMNSLTPAIFVIIGYIFAIALRDVKDCAHHLDHNNLRLSNEQVNLYTTFTNTDITRLTISIEIILLFLYLLIYLLLYIIIHLTKKCNNNNLC